MADPATVIPATEVVPVESKKDVFKNKKQIWDPSKEYQRAIFGGHLLGQSVRAAEQTVPDVYDVHSLQSTFLKAGDASIDVFYHVDRVLDGRTLSSRLVRAMQGDVVIYVATIGFQRRAAQPAPTGGALSYHEPAPAWVKSVDPEDKNLISSRDMLGITGFPQYLIDGFHHPFEWKYLPLEPAEPTEFRSRSIFRSFPLNTAERQAHLAAMAWTSDVFLIYTANLANPAKFPVGMGNVTIETSVNHSVWFHSPSTRIDEWVACERRTSWGADGRVLIYQTWWSKEDGRLILSCVQEALLRLKTANL
ncbi:hypothetical protein PFICI_02234 [Pestalotiopsis fici W106-1]|uniref:Acyl-CoA thioesterase II n=1 Tax=Pestalotiopsis fici (strain W106-1 / CGMCC3.15140) TaxID=1229662 RepID=W3XDV9_PESFW|nr:uncharacterized protein PFICI_02234 [Pestalotiopsis fici W106-1]ETS84209.1 hypothetical protein PFICI_02234 [Pestalotiopsis fici W106-1]